MDAEVIQAAKMAEENSHPDDSNVQNVSQHDLQNVSPEIRDLLDMFAKQNKTDSEIVDNSDFENVKTKKEVLVYEELQSKEYLTLYATNEEAPAEAQVIQFNPEVSNQYSTYFDPSQVDMTGLKSYQVFNIDPNQVKNAYPTFITPKPAQDQTSYSIPSVKSDAETSLNSSGYISANSPIESIANSPADTDNSPKDAESQDSSSSLSPADPLSLPSPDPSAPESSNSRHSSNPYKIPTWVKQVYPELYQTWENLSASEFYQGGVELLCSICKKNPYSGFHENLPVCEADRIGRACTVCKLRSASGFSYGLALCEADRLFLYRTFTQETQFDKCVSQCPVTVQKWCGYCRFRTCLSTKGFRFFTQASTRVLIDQEPTGNSRKRKYSGKGIMKELNFIPDSVAQDSIFIPNAPSASPGPGFGVPTPAQAKQAFADGASQAQTDPTTVKSTSSQSLAAANPTLLQALSQPISTPVTSYNQSPGPNFSNPSFNLRSGISKAEMASSVQARGPTQQARAFVPPTAVSAQSLAFTQQQQQPTPQGRAYTPLPLTSSNARATTSTPLPPMMRDQNLAFMPPSSGQMGMYSQYPTNMAFMQHPGRNAPLPPGVVPGNTTHMPQSSAYPSRNSHLARTPPFPTPQSRLYHPQAYSPYPNQVRQPVQSVPTPYFNGSSLGTKNKKGTGTVGVLVDPAKQDWVREQQEKYLKFHLRLYRTRGK
eukprot:GFUD01017204.1.p1 GENE.GFUD01017204.1~~GFUD01017204.1.p1  ORF type:complete len:712 (-),score=168.54 GFUD01017204.1:174-2309(-)